MNLQLNLDSQNIEEPTLIERKALLNEISSTYSMNLSQLTKLCDLKPIGEIKSIISYVEERIRSGSVKNHKGFLTAALKENYAVKDQLTKIIELEVANVNKEKLKQDHERNQALFKKKQLYEAETDTTKEEHQKKFIQLKSTIKNKYGEAALESWFNDLELLYIHEKEVCLNTTSKYKKDWLDIHYLEAIKDFFAVDKIDIVLYDKDTELQEA